MSKEWKLLLPYVTRYAPSYLVGLIALVIANSGQLYIPQLLKKALNLIALESFSWDSLLMLLVTLVGVAFLISVTRFLWRRTIFGASQKIISHLRSRLFRHFLSLPSSFFERNKVGDLLMRCTHDTEELRMSMGFGVVSLVDGVFISLAVIVILFHSYTSLALIFISPLLVLIPVMTFLVVLYGKQALTTREKYAILGSHIQENLSGVRIIKGFAQENVTMREFQEVSRHHLKASVAMRITWRLFGLFMDAFVMLASLFLLYFGGRKILAGVLTPGDFLAILAYISLLAWPMLAIGIAIGLFQQGQVSLKRLLHVLDEEPSIMSRPGALECPEGDILIRGLSYTFPGARQSALKDISLTIREGATLGILGPVGSGKSVFARLLVRTLNPPEGTIWYGRNEIHHISLASLRNTVGVVPQDPLLFSDSIKANIAFGRPEASDEDLEEAAVLSTIASDFKAFSEGWMTHVGERGISLSGGQKQRITLARVRVTHPRILILDDAFSAVDTETEERILRNLLPKRAGMTTLLISQRVSTLKNADLIIVLEEGRVTQKGSHEELSSQEGTYAKIYRIQRSESGSS